MTDAGLAHLAGLTGLQRLYLGNTRVTDAGLAHLKELTGLRHLDLEETGVTDAGLAHLEGLTEPRAARPRPHPGRRRRGWPTWGG